MCVCKSNTHAVMCWSYLLREKTTQKQVCPTLRNNSVVNARDDSYPAPFCGSNHRELVTPFQTTQSLFFLLSFGLIGLNKFSSSVDQQGFPFTVCKYVALRGTHVDFLRHRSALAVHRVTAQPQAWFTDTPPFSVLTGLTM